jgi:hypothetical protein
VDKLVVSGNVDNVGVAAKLVLDSVNRDVVPSDDSCETEVKESEDTTDVVEDVTNVGEVITDVVESMTVVVKADPEVSWVFSEERVDRVDVSNICCVEENIVCSPNREDSDCSTLFFKKYGHYEGIVS